MSCQEEKILEEVEAQMVHTVVAMPTNFQLYNNKHCRPVRSIVKPTLSMREVRGSIPGSVKSKERRRQIVTAATFLRSCVPRC